MIKATRRVGDYVRNGRRVSGYTSNYTPRVKNLFNQHYEKLSKWSMQSAFHQIAKGTHINSIDDAWLAGMEHALEGLRRYKPSKGDLVKYIRPLIKFGIQKHIHWERSKGLKGTRTLYDLIHAATTDEEREKIIERFPEVSQIDETIPTGSIEDVHEAARALLQRDALLDQIEREFGANLKQARAKLREKERKRETWKKVSIAKRQIKTYRMKTFDNMSFRQIADKLGISVDRAYNDFKTVGEVIRKIRSQMADTKKALSGQSDAERRFALNIERLHRACENSYPEDYQEYLLDVLAGLLSRLAVSPD
jgi:hypothetical protein